MATGEQVKTLIKAHYDHDDSRFRAAALCIAASETKQGHSTLGRDIKALVESAGQPSARVITLANKDNLFLVSAPKVRLNELVVSDELSSKITRILNEYRNRDKLEAYGLSCRRKVLLEGDPGTGKTLTASVVASSFGLPLFTVQVDKLITKFLGETSTKLRQIFDTIASNRAVYFFDEFDAIGADRGLDNEVGEMRRILNSFLQFIENDNSSSIIIAATNNKRILDQALFRRFDDVLHYDLPSVEEVRRIVELKTGAFDSTFRIGNTAANALSKFCQAEIARLCEDAIKECLLSDKILSDELFISLCTDRAVVYSEQRVS